MTYSYITQPQIEKSLFGKLFEKLYRKTVIESIELTRGNRNYHASTIENLLKSEDLDDVRLLSIKPNPKHDKIDGKYSINEVLNKFFKTSDDNGINRIRGIDVIKLESLHPGTQYWIAGYSYKNEVNQKYDIIFKIADYKESMDWKEKWFRFIEKSFQEFRAGFDPRVLENLFYH